MAASLASNKTANVSVGSFSRSNFQRSREIRGFLLLWWRMLKFGQSVTGPEAKPAAEPASRRRALRSLLPNDAELLAALLGTEPGSPESGPFEKPDPPDQAPRKPK